MSFPHRRHAERNSVETPHVKTCLLFRPHLRPHFWLSRGALSSLCALSESVSVTTATSPQAPMGTVLNFDGTSHLTDHRGNTRQVSRVIAFVFSDVSYLHADGHRCWIIHTPARQAERVRAPRKTGVWQSVAPPHSLRARSMYSGKQRRHFDRL